ncbi:MAG: LD-carboxypeptidase [Parcubacteria group bacterium]|nr:LD-carboxypeptidase [Parcubacteria group bacterium]
MLLPRKLTKESAVHMIHLSSPVAPSDLSYFHLAVERLSKEFTKFKLFDVVKNGLEPRYLAASARERLRKLRLALKDADWLLPVYGGTGAINILRYLDKEDLEKFAERSPIVSGFSDATSLLNFLYFKVGLVTFHYANAAGLFAKKNYKLFFDIISGAKTEVTFKTPNYAWLTDVPTTPIEGTAIGGNFETLRDLLDVFDIEIHSWKKYILFIEDINDDVESLHRIITALEARGIFDRIRALVVGKFETRKLATNLTKIARLFGVKIEEEEKPTHVLLYLLQNVLETRKKENDPLYILNIDNFGHGETPSPIIIPIGGTTTLSPDKEIRFIGPFVR